MNTTRTGKIARLPHHIRDQLNGRLYEGEPAKHLALWLNSLPEVQAILAAGFGAKPIRPQNLSERKQGGYRDWLLQQEALELVRRLAEDAGELQACLHRGAASPPEQPCLEQSQSSMPIPHSPPSPATEPQAGENSSPRPVPQSSSCPADRPRFTDLLALWLAARYALLTRTLTADEGPEQWRRLRELCADVVELRRGDQTAERLRLDRLRLAQSHLL